MHIAAEHPTPSNSMFSLSLLRAGVEVRASTTHSGAMSLPLARLTHLVRLTPASAGPLPVRMPRLRMSASKAEAAGVSVFGIAGTRSFVITAQRPYNYEPNGHNGRRQGQQKQRIYQGVPVSPQEMPPRSSFEDGGYSQRNYSGSPIPPTREGGTAGAQHRHANGCALGDGKRAGVLLYASGSCAGVGPTAVQLLRRGVDAHAG